MAVATGSSNQVVNFVGEVGFYFSGLSALSTKPRFVSKATTDFARIDKRYVADWRQGTKRFGRVSEIAGINVMSISATNIAR